MSDQTMTFFKEHLPKKDDPKAALCGEKRNPIVIELERDNDIDVWCKKCRKLACPDCMGSGLMGGGETGIYCSCSYADYALMRNGEL